MRPPSFSCTWWKETSLDCVAEYSLTGMLTSPNERAPFQMLRIRRFSHSSGLSSGRKRGQRRLQLCAYAISRTRPAERKCHGLVDPGCPEPLELRPHLFRRTRDAQLIDELVGQ